MPSPSPLVGLHSAKCPAIAAADSTANGETELRLLTNLPTTVSALRIAELYRERWTLERHFDFLKNCLHGELESLGKPCAALFTMCLALVAGNALAVVRQAVRTTHGEEELQRLSRYYLADELARNQHAIDVLVAEHAWHRLQELSVPAFWHWMQQVARHIRTRAFHKHSRGPKRPPSKRASGKHRHHYSTYRLLQAEKNLERDDCRATGAVKLTEATRRALPVETAFRSRRRSLPDLSAAKPPPIACGNRGHPVQSGAPGLAMTTGTRRRTS